MPLKAQVLQAQLYSEIYVVPFNLNFHEYLFLNLNNLLKGLCPCDPNSFFDLTKKRNQKKSRLCSPCSKIQRLTTKIF